MVIDSGALMVSVVWCGTNTSKGRSCTSKSYAIVVTIIKNDILFIAHGVIALIREQIKV